MNPQQRRAPQSHWIYRTPRSFLAAALSFACVMPFNVDLSSGAEAREKKPKQDPILKGLPVKELSTDEAILHALNRLGYGPRPGEVESIRRRGLEKWIEEQLNPNSLDDNPLEAKLEDYPTLKMSAARLQEMYPPPKQAEKQAANLAQIEQKTSNAPGDSNPSASMKDEPSGSNPATRGAGWRNE